MAVEWIDDLISDIGICAHYKCNYLLKYTRIPSGMIADKFPAKLDVFTVVVGHMKTGWLLGKYKRFAYDQGFVPFCVCPRVFVCWRLLRS